MKIPVLFPKIFDHPFTYESDIQENLKPGDFVKAPFGSSEITGVVWPFEEKTEKKFKIKKISRKINVEKLNSKMINFINWFSKYNLVSLGMSLKMCLLNKGAVEKDYEDEFNKYNFTKFENKFLLNEEQKKSLSFLRNSGDNYNVLVIEGVTGSGKTLVYFERIKDFINKDSQVLILLPEIALTNQFSKRYKEFFGTEPAVWHSGTSKKNKSIIWKGVTENKIKIVIGARSSLFLPFKKLGTIIVDEEHDISYKQDEGISYNARDMAITRAYLENIPINLVTSIPSVETYNNIVKKKYKVTKIKKRYKEASLPNIEIINLNSEILKKESWIANKTIKMVNHYLEKGDQILFFLNRRGYAPFVICKKCGYRFQCPNCDVNLNFHKNLNKLLCHHCGYKSILSRLCNDKKKCDFLFCGPGVERIFVELKKIFPKKRILLVRDLKLNKYIELPYDKVFLSAGPIETAKIILNSFNNIKKINIKETQHFFSFITTKKKLKTRFFDLNFDKYKFSCQLYSIKNIFNVFFKKKLNLDKNNFYLGQCYLNSDLSGHISVIKKKNKFRIVGVKNNIFNKDLLLRKINKFNKNNNYLKIKRLIFNSIGSSNHLGASIPMANKKQKSKLHVNKYGELNLAKNIFVCDSSVLNEIDITPITLFSMNNILGMILNNNKLHDKN